jgi:hypothetical protein
MNRAERRRLQKRGKVRLKRLLDQVNEIFDCIDKDYVTIEDIKKAIFEETGILIK